MFVAATRLARWATRGRSTGPHLHYEIRFDNRPQSVRKAIKTLKKQRGA